jgi:ABC-type dipeptide/oligopeptide/nickel transport system ATPase component
MSLLEVENLRVHFHDAAPDRFAVDGVSFSMEEGDILGLVGESGTGKTVTSMCIGGLLPRWKADTQGSIRLDGTEIFDCSQKELNEILGKELTVVFQEPMTSFNPVYRIGRQIGESLYVHRKDLSQSQRNELILDAMRRAGLYEAEEISRRYPHELSGGMLQRAMIAAAIVTNPKLLIADEITTALDVTMQARIIDQLKRLNRESGMSILFISHDMHVVNRLCRQVIVMQRGRIVESGLTKEIFANPQHEYTKRLIAAIPSRYSGR